MDIEFEATYIDVDIVDFRAKLRAGGAKLKRAEYLQQRVTLELPPEKSSGDAWMRVRDEGDKITLTYKNVSGESIEGQKELMVVVDDFKTTVSLLEKMGCEKRSFQESKRELWILDDAEVTIDTWPFLEPYVEIEGASEEHVRSVSEQLGFNYSDAKFCSTSEIYRLKYGKTLEDLPENILKRFVFDIENPFLR